MKLMKSLAKGGPVHAKYRRMIAVYVDITAPLYWWKEFDTYKVGTVANTCTTMHKIHAKEFTIEDVENKTSIKAEYNKEQYWLVKNGSHVLINSYTSTEEDFKEYFGSPTDPKRKKKDIIYYTKRVKYIKVVD